jgi:thiamine biosynthesis lipoprotein ApbE/Na+-translocating ferredoxin:NAD+ oxidoreductase RnfG subunit
MATAAVPASGEVYLTEAQALAAVLGEKAIVRKEEKPLDEALRKKLEQANNLRFPESSYSFFIAAQDGKPVKYALVLNEIGKSEPITFMVGMSPEGKITDVVIMAFRENRGWEVKEKRFLNQFRGKSSKSAVRVDEDIINYTGATLSSKAVARGVKRALVLLDAFYPGEARYRLAAATDFARPMAFSPIAAAETGAGTVGLYRQARYAMGTVCEIRLWCRNPGEVHQLFVDGFGELDRIEGIFSAYRADSELNRVNRAAGGGPVALSEQFFLLTRDAIRLSRTSDGSVDFTVGPLLNAWGLRMGKPRVPSPMELQEARRLVGADKLDLDQQAQTLWFKRPGMELDFGGFAKGYAAGRMAQLLQGQGAVSVLVNLGRSSICASSLAAGSQAGVGGEEAGLCLGEWPIAIAHPEGSRRPPLFLKLKAGESLSTSGTTEQQFEAQGKSLSHILDPRTGLPAEGTRSATVVSRSGTRSEALSKELLLAAREDRRAWAKQRAVAAWAHLEISPSGALVEEAGTSN